MPFTHMQVFTQSLQLLMKKKEKIYKGVRGPASLENFESRD